MGHTDAVQFKNDQHLYTLYFQEYFINRNWPYLREQMSEPDKVVATEEIINYSWILDCMKRYPQDSIFIDIGGNSGLCAVPICLAGYETHCFEPVTSNMKLLEKAREINSLNNLFLYQKALSDFNGKSKIYVPTTHGEDNSSLSEDVLTKGVGGNIEEYEVEVATFDSFLSSAPMIDPSKIGIIKIDTQGFEHPILLGMTEFLQEHSPALIIEVEEDILERAGYSSADMNQILTDIGYKVMHTFHSDYLYLK